MLENKTGSLKAPVWKQVASCKPRASSANSMDGAYEVGIICDCAVVDSGVSFVFFKGKKKNTHMA